MKRDRPHYRSKLKKSIELERQIQSLKDQTSDRLCDLGDRVYELENKLFTLSFLLGGVSTIILALIIWQINTHFTV